jgi:Nif11 domain
LDGFVSFVGFWVVGREFLKKYLRGTHGCGGLLVEGLASSMLPSTEAPRCWIEGDDITYVNFVREGTAMTVKAALAFIDRVRRDERLRDKIALLGRDPSLEALVRLGEAESFGFSSRELREAHRHDWTLRWLAGSSANGAPPAENRASSSEASTE